MITATPPPQHSRHACLRQFVVAHCKPNQKGISLPHDVCSGTGCLQGSVQTLASPRTASLQWLIHDVDAVAGVSIALSAALEARAAGPAQTRTCHHQWLHLQASRYLGPQRWRLQGCWWDRDIDPALHDERSRGIGWGHCAAAAKAAMLKR